MAERVTPPLGRRLTPGESASAVVNARSRWNDTGIDLEAGIRYRFRAEGAWFDRGLHGDPDGLYQRSWVHRFGFLRRVGDADWFTLVGTVGRSTRTAFRIGSESTSQMRQGGRLLCFANDAAWFYGNNSGEVTLTVERDS